LKNLPFRGKLLDISIDKKTHVEIYEK